MSKNLQTELLAEIVRRILVVSDPEQIILFGSRARAESGPDSDVDLLVIEAGDRRAASGKCANSPGFAWITCSDRCHCGYPPANRSAS